MNFRSFIIITRPANGEQENRAEIWQREAHSTVLSTKHLFCRWRGFYTDHCNKKPAKHFFYFKYIAVCVFFVPLFISAHTTFDDWQWGRSICKFQEWNVFKLNFFKRTIEYEISNTTLNSSRVPQQFFLLEVLPITRTEQSIIYPEVPTRNIETYI